MFRVKERRQTVWFANFAEITYIGIGSCKSAAFLDFTQIKLPKYAGTVKSD